MQIGFPLALYGTVVGAGASSKSSERQPFSAGNKTPYTVTNTTNRFFNVRKRETVANNANWSDPQTEFANWADNQTTHASYMNVIVEGAIKHANGSFYRGQYSGANSKVILANDSGRSDNIGCPALAKGTRFEKCFRLVLPLLYKSKTTSFTVGEVVTGGTSGATGTIAAIEVVNSTTGKLTLTSETGVFTDSEVLTGNLGGSAAVDYTTNQSLLCTVTSQPFNQEGVRAGKDPSVNWTVTDPCVQATFTANVSGGVITSVTRTSAGSGNTSSPTFWAYEVMPDGTLQYKNIGYGFLSAGTVTGIGGLSGSAPTGYTWTNPTIVLGGGSGFGAASTLIPDFSLVDAIPDVPVESITIIGDSIGRGNSSTDVNGDINGLYGIYERGIGLRCGIINMSASGGALGNQVQFATTFAKMYGLYMGKTTRALITLGSNDVVAGTSENTIQNNMNTLATEVRSYGAKVDFAVLMQRGTDSSGLNVTGISKASSAVVTVNNSLPVGATVYFNTAIGGMTQIRGLFGTVTAATSTTITVNIDSTAFSTYTSGGQIVPLAPTTAQTTATGFGAGGVAANINTKLLNGTIVSDRQPINARQILEDSVVYNAWQVASPPWTLDLIHPNPAGIARIANDAAFSTQFSYLA